MLTLLFISNRFWVIIGKYFPYKIFLIPTSKQSGNCSSFYIELLNYQPLHVKLVSRDRFVVVKPDYPSRKWRKYSIWNRNGALHVHNLISSAHNLIGYSRQHCKLVWKVYATVPYVFILSFMYTQIKIPCTMYMIFVISLCHCRCE